jgi:signal transduction histidine kinase
MKKFFVFVLMALVAVGTLTARQKKGTTAEAEALVKKAIAQLKANGKDKAFGEISDPKGKFVSGDLYVFVYDISGKCVAHGGNAKMIGKDLIELKDADGKAFVKERVEIAKTKGSGWQNYKWNNPTTNKIEDKVAYVEKYEDVIVGCGAYK